MVRPKTQYKYKQYEDRFNLNPASQIESMFATVGKPSTSLKKDNTKMSPPNPGHLNQKKHRERSSWDRKDEKTQYNEQELAINSKGKVDKSNKHRNYMDDQQPTSDKPSKKYVDDEKDTDDSDEFFQLIRDTVAESVKVCIK